MLRSCTFAFRDAQFLVEIFLFQPHFLCCFFILNLLNRLFECLCRLLSCDFYGPVEPLGQSLALPRGEIVEFTPASRRRMLELLAKVEQAVGPLAFTLT